MALPGSEVCDEYRYTVLENTRIECSIIVLFVDVFLLLIIFYYYYYFF